jgi:hypothetical protein
MFVVCSPRAMRCESDHKQPSAMMLGKFSTWVMWKILGFCGTMPGISSGLGWFVAGAPRAEHLDR